MFWSCLISLLVSPMGYALPSSIGIKQCTQSGSELEDCIKIGLNSAIPSLAKGWFGNDTALDPLLLGKVESDYSDGHMTLTLVLRDVVMVGLASATVQQVKSKSLEEGKLELMCKINCVSTTGVYSSEGYLVNFPLHSQGIFNITLSDLTLLVILHLQRDGDYLQVSDLKLNMIPAKIDAQVGKEFDGDNSLGVTLNLYINENSFEIFELLRPKLLSYFSVMIKDLSNSILMLNTKDSLFPNLQI